MQYIGLCVVVTVCLLVITSVLQPTVCHYFIKLLKDKGLLRRCYSLPWLALVIKHVACYDSGPEGGYLIRRGWDSPHRLK